MKRLVLVTLTLLLGLTGAVSAHQDGENSEQNTTRSMEVEENEPEGLSPADFRVANPHRSQKSYQRFKEKFNDLRVDLNWDNAEYRTWVNIITQNSIKRRIQWEIDEYDVTDPQQIQQIIDYYDSVTPKQGELILHVQVRAPRMNNPVFEQYLEDLPARLHLVYGNRGQQKRLDFLENQTELDFEPIPERQLHYKGYALDPNVSYQRSLDGETSSPPSWNTSARAYQIGLKYSADEATIDDIESFLKRDEDVGLWLVYSEAQAHSTRELERWTEAAVLNQLHPALVDAWEHQGELSNDVTERAAPGNEYKPKDDQDSTSRSMTGGGY